MAFQASGIEPFDNSLTVCQLLWRGHEQICAQPIHKKLARILFLCDKLDVAS
jgi:hypothetical protein